MTDAENSLLKQVETLTKACELLRKKCEQSEQAYTVLMHQVKQMLRYRFGQKSERYSDANDPQWSLFEHVDLTIEPEPELEDDETESQADNVVDIKSGKPRQKTKRAFADHLLRVPVVIPVEEHDKTCRVVVRKKSSSTNIMNA
jgi:transposase